MKQTIIAMFSSKKFLATLVTAIVAVSARVGFDADPQMVGLIVGLGAAYVTAQGVTDHGKSKAEIDAKTGQSANTDSTST